MAVELPRAGLSVGLRLVTNVDVPERRNSKCKALCIGEQHKLEHTIKSVDRS
jgi:hypothetical protein